MKCSHCGLCCSSPFTQINLTIGDIWRIADFLKQDIEELFKDHIGLNPFREPEFENIYNIDLGLNLPCRFRKDGKCNIYPARPLNCRLFPQWVLAEMPDNKIEEILKGHECEYDLSKKWEYKRYVEAIGKILIQESAFYRIFKRISIKGLFDIKGNNKIEKEYYIVQNLRKMFKNDLKTEEIKKAINKNLNKIKENKKKIEEIENES